MLKKISKLVRLVTVFLLIACIASSGQFAYAQGLTGEERDAILGNAPVYVPQAATTGGACLTSGLIEGSTAAGDATGYPIRAPVISDPAKLAASIDAYIKKSKANSPLNGLGTYFVQGGMRAGINPILVVAHAQHETGFGTNGSGIGSGSNNSFGRSASSSQPGVNTSRKWYKWDSWQASLLSPTFPANGSSSQPDDIFQYIARRFSNNLDYGLESYFEGPNGRPAYAPSSDNNNVAAYIASVLRTSDEIAAGAAGAIDLTKVGSVTPGAAPEAAPTNPTGCATAVGDASTFVDGFTIYSQYDPAWKDLPFGSNQPATQSTIGESGCGPSAMAMAITALTGTKVTPVETTLFADTKGIYRPGEGSSWSVAPMLARQWGLRTERVGKDQVKIANALRGGGVVVTSGTGGKPFTSGGHYIVIRAITAEGNYKVGDSGHKDTSDKEWPPGPILDSMSEGSSYAVFK